MFCTPISTTSTLVSPTSFQPKYDRFQKSGA
jgi:hypothetical protein